MLIKKLLSVLGLIFLLAPTSYAAEKVKIVFDGRQWELGWSAPKNLAASEETTDEYVLHGESVESWTELVTVQFFPGLQKNVSQEVYITGMKVHFLKACPGLVWKDVRVSEKDSMYEWTVANCGGVNDQSEIARVVRTGRGVHVWHYAIKKSPMPSDRQTEWIKNLDAFQVVNR